MDRGCLWSNVGVREIAPRNDLELRILRNKLVNLTLDWELEALALDAKRYRESVADQRDHLRDNALAYRKCIAKLSGLLNSSSLLACKTELEP